MRILVAFTVGLVIGLYPQSAMMIAADIIELVKVSYEQLTQHAQ